MPAQLRFQDACRASRRDRGTLTTEETAATAEAMEDNGARSNPQARVELARLAAAHRRLLDEAATARPVAKRVSARTQVLPWVTRVLQAADRPLRACDVHAAATELAGEPLNWSSVKAALASRSTGTHPRFRRVGYGTYELR